ncbi:type I restriction endonuclease subunit S [Bacteroidia bacterium]|nr:type I restriction endonuclease subunit S [Bacteroidia bacterium]
MSEWKKYKLGDLVTFNYGKSLVADKRIIGDIPVYSSAGISGWHDEYLVNSDAIIIGRKGTVGSVYYSNKPFYCIDTAYYILPDESYDLKFLYYKLLSMNLVKLRSDSAVPGLNRETAYAQDLSIPESIEDQHQIASILSSLDDKIELNLQMNQTLEAMAQAIFKEWFVDFHFPGADGVLVDGLPKRWKKGRLGEITFIQNGYAFKSDDFSNEGENGILKIKNISNNVVDIINMQYIPNVVAENIDSRFKVKSGDLLIAMTGAEVGKVGIVPNTDKELWLNQRVGSFREKTKYSKWFSYLILSTPEYQNVLLSTASGSAQPNISASQIENVEIILPNNEIIEQFGNIINSLFERIIENYSHNQTLTQVRDSLLPRLMSGEVQVNKKNK